MTTLSRRDFLKLGGVLAAAAGMGAHEAIFAEGLSQIANNHVRIIWTQGQSCSGCSVSLLNTESPGALELLTQYISLVSHQTIGAAQGEQFMEVIDKVENAGPFILVVEGSVPQGMPEACMIGGRKFTDSVSKLAKKAKYVVSAGTCAAFGGIPAAEGNPTGAVSMKEFMDDQGIPTNQRLVNCPSCPVHPNSIVGTLAYLAGHGYPKVNTELLTPDMYYAHSTHDNCPRYHDYTKEIFAEKFGDPGCLFKLGCLGFLAHTECPNRQWNSGANWCIRSSAPCTACSSQDFAKRKDFPFYRIGEKYHSVSYNESMRKEG